MPEVPAIARAFAPPKVAEWSVTYLKSCDFGYNPGPIFGFALRIDGLYFFTQESHAFGHLCFAEAVKNQRDIKLKVVEQ